MSIQLVCRKLSGRRLDYLLLNRRHLPHLCLGFVFIFATPARAQIYSWRDTNGHLVLSNHRAPDANLAPTYAVPSAETVRTTRLASVERTSSYDQLISDHARRNGVREDLVRAVVQVESAFNPYARSPKGALGLMQLMPAIIQQFGVANPFDAAENVRAGVSYLRQLLDRYNNNEQLALAAYNAGSGAVDRHGQSIPPYAETEHYIAKVTGIAGRPLEPKHTLFYKVVEIIDGREIVRYTDRKPNP